MHLDEIVGRDGTRGARKTPSIDNGAHLGKLVHLHTVCSGLSVRVRIWQEPMDADSIIRYWKLEDVYLPGWCSLCWAHDSESMLIPDRD